MTQQTDYHLPTAALTTAGEKLARLGLDCPWVGENAWVHLETLSILDRVHEIDIVVPPAVAAAVVWFAIRARRWDMVRQMRNHTEAVKGMDYHDRIDRKPWPRQFPETVEEAAALITAVADALEEA